MKYAVVRDAVGSIQEIAIFCKNQVLSSEYEEVSFSDYETFRDSINSIEAIKIHCCDHIDKKAGDVRLKYITDVPGQQATYQMKSEECRQIKQLGLSDTDDLTYFPLVRAEMKVTGLTCTQVVNMILGIEAQWKFLAAAIEEARRMGKQSVMAQTDINMVLTQEQFALNALSVL